LDCRLRGDLKFRRTDSRLGVETALNEGVCLNEGGMDSQGGRTGCVETSRVSLQNYRPVDLLGIFCESKACCKNPRCQYGTQ
jgi:hypothetical protein